MNQRELVGHALRGLTLTYDERVAKLAGMQNKSLAAELDSLMNQLIFARLLTLLAREQGFEDALFTYLRDGVADEQRPAA